MRKYITEFIGTFFLVLTIGTVLNGGGLGQAAPVAIGSVLMVMVYAGGHISGAHYNPAVTLAVLLRGRITLMEAIFYMIVQIIGAAAAAGTVFFLVKTMPEEASVLPDTTRALVAEVLGTFALAYVVLNVATAKPNSHQGNSFYGLAIGFTVLSMAYALGSFSGGAFNPAVAIGISIMKMTAWENIWIYLVGCFGGAAIAALVFRINNRDDK